MAMTMKDFKISDKELLIPEMDGFPSGPASKALVAQAEMVRRIVLPYSPIERLAFIKAKIDRYLDVVGVWRDPAEPGGIRLHPIKTGPVLHAFADGDENPSADASITNRVFAVPCVDEKQALRLQSEFGNYVTRITPSKLRKAIQLGWLLEDAAPCTRLH
jgi:hypothetical protein